MPVPHPSSSWNDRRSMKYLAFASLSPSRYCQAVNLGEWSWEGLREITRLPWMINYFTGKPRVDEHGSEVCTAELHITGAAVQERGSHTWTCGILGWGSYFHGLCYDSLLCLAVTPNSCLKEHCLWSQRKYWLREGKAVLAVGTGAELKVELIIGVILLFCWCQFWGSQ